MASCSTDDGSTSATTSATAVETSTTVIDESAAPAGGVATAEAVPSTGCGTSSMASVSLERHTLPSSDR